MNNCSLTQARHTPVHLKLRLPFKSRRRNESSRLDRVSEVCKRDGSRNRWRLSPRAGERVDSLRHGDGPAATNHAALQLRDKHVVQTSCFRRHHSSVIDELTSRHSIRTTKPFGADNCHHGRCPNPHAPCLRPGGTRAELSGRFEESLATDTEPQRCRQTPRPSGDRFFP